MKTIIDYTEEIKAYADYKAGTSLVQIPSVVGDTFTYDGTQQGPTITGLDTTKCTVTNATKINAGTYTLTIALNDTSKMVWDDLTTTDKTYTYTINKANGAITLSKNSVSLDTSTPSDTVTFSGNTGAVTVSSSDDTIATASVSNNTITITAVASGTATITVNVAGSDNYNSTSTTISVEATLGPALVPWSTGTDEEIKAMLDAFYEGELTRADLASVWSIGDERAVSLSAMSATGVGESHVAQSVVMVLMNAGGKTLEDDTTECAYVVGQKNAFVKHDGGAAVAESGYYNSSADNRWSRSKRRTWCNDVYYNAIPDGFRVLLKRFINATATGGSTTAKKNIVTTYDWVSLASEIEVYGNNSYSASGEGTLFQYYSISNNRIKYIGNYKANPTDWWTRSPSVNRTEAKYANSVRSNGACGPYTVTSSTGIVPIFCI